MRIDDGEVNFRESRFTGASMDIGDLLGAGLWVTGETSGIIQDCVFDGN